LILGRELRGCSSVVNDSVSFGDVTSRKTEGKEEMIFFTGDIMSLGEEFSYDDTCLGLFEECMDMDFIMEGQYEDNFDEYLSEYWGDNVLYCMF